MAPRATVTATRRGLPRALRAGTLALLAAVLTGCAVGSSDGTSDGATTASGDGTATDTVSGDGGAPTADAPPPDDVRSDTDSAGADATDVGAVDAGATDAVGALDAGATDAGATDSASDNVPAVVDAATDVPTGMDVPTDDGGELTCPTGQSVCDGVCTVTGTDVAHCGGCGQRCTVASGTPVCRAGVCAVAGCTAGHADCDGLASTGCETALAATGTCGSGTDLGAFCADVSCGFGCFSTSPRGVASRTGHNGVWFHARANECSNCPASLEVRVTLASPAGMDYDLYVWAPCGVLLGSSIRGAGLVDTVIASHPDNVLVDDSFDYYIEVRYVSGTTCATWTLTVDARGPSATSC